MNASTLEEHTLKQPFASGQRGDLEAKAMSKSLSSMSARMPRVVTPYVKPLTSCATSNQGAQQIGRQHITTWKGVGRVAVHVGDG
jgi:hypothetical protein